ncbi:hypothetical protein K3495_g8618 [Podosphaera aphanis]|nr:hypothetical protein K3495_g8618 [Podosphaera aphanis]
MTSRHSAARPKRAGEQFARTHQRESSSSHHKRPKFDVRNPSALAPDAPEEDTVLEADVIGDRGLGTKRGAINIDGYDSDSDNEAFNTRAEARARAKGKKSAEGVSLAEAFQDATGVKDPDLDDDMFANTDSADDGDAPAQGQDKSSQKKKGIRFLEVDEIEGQIDSSISGGHISGNFALDPKGKLSTHAMDDRVSSDDEEDALLNAMEEDVDEEVGAGGLKRNAPKVDAFNMKNEQEEGRFDDAGNYIRKAVDPDAKHDVWMEGVSKKDMKRAAEAHEKREAERRKKRQQDDGILLPDILRKLILQLEKGESVLEALARLGRRQIKPKKIPKWKQSKQRPNGHDAMAIDTDKPAEDAEQASVREAVVTITDAADKLLTRGQTDIYEQVREMLIRQYQRETHEDWVEPPAEETRLEEKNDAERSAIRWEYRWTDGREDTSGQGAYDGATMAAWKGAGYFSGNVEFRREGDIGPWSRTVDFL